MYSHECALSLHQMIFLPGYPRIKIALMKVDYRHICGLSVTVPLPSVFKYKYCLRKIEFKFPLKIKLRIIVMLLAHPNLIKFNLVIHDWWQYRDNAVPNSIQRTLFGTIYTTHQNISHNVMYVIKGFALTFIDSLSTACFRGYCYMVCTLLITAGYFENIMI